MSLHDQIAQDLKNTALADFGEDVTYTTTDGTAILTKAIIEDGINLGKGFPEMDKAFRTGLGRYAVVRVSSLDVPNPQYRDQVTQTDGTVWTVQQKQYRAGQWKLYCSTDERGAF